MRKVEQKLAITQAEIDALRDELQAAEDEFDTFKIDTETHSAELQKEIDDLKAQNPAVDFTGVQAVADALKAKLDAAIAPPTPDPGPA